MKKQWMRMLGGAALLMLSACGQNNSLLIGQGFNMGANVVGGDSAVSISTKVITNTQPTLSFTVDPQSVSLTLTSYHVEFKNKDGSAYGGTYGVLDANTSTRVLGGFACVSSDGTTVDTTTDQCLNGQTKTPYARSVSYPNSLSIVTTGLSDLIATQCLTSFCPDLHYNLTINGVDGAGRNQSFTFNNVVYLAHLVQ